MYVCGRMRILSKEAADGGKRRCRRSHAVFNLVERWNCLVLEQRTTVDSGTAGLCAPPRQLPPKDLLCKRKPMPHRSTHSDSEAAEGGTGEQSTWRWEHSPARTSCSATLELYRGWLCRFRQMLLAIFAARAKMVVHGTISTLSLCMSESCIISWAKKWQVYCLVRHNRAL